MLRERLPVVHGAGVPRAPRRHPDDDQRQGRPQEPARAHGPARPAGRSTSPRSGRPRPPSPSCSAETLGLDQGLGRPPTSSTTSAPTRCCWPGSARRSAGTPICHRCRPARCTCNPTVTALAPLQPTRPASRHRRAQRRPDLAVTRRGRTDPRRVRRGAAAPVPRLAGDGGGTYRVPVGGRPRPASSGPTCARWPGARAPSSASRCCRSSAKWLLVGRFKPWSSPRGGPAYLRFWLVKTLIRANPMALFTGIAAVPAVPARPRRARPAPSCSPRACPRARTCSRSEPRTVIREDASISGYRAEAGRIQTGHGHARRDVVVGEQTVLDIDAAIGDGGVLGHCSSLQPGQRVPAGQRWHGSPAEPARLRTREVPPARCGTAPVRFSVLQLRTCSAVPRSAFAAVVEVTSSCRGRDAARPAPAACPTPCCTPRSRRPRGAVLRRHAHRARLRAHRAAAVHACSCDRTGCTRSTASGTGRTGSSGARRTRDLHRSASATARSSSATSSAIGYDLPRVQQTGSNFGASCGRTRRT